MQKYKVTLLKGDGIGPEIVDEAVKVLNAAGEKYDFSIEYTEALLGGAAMKRLRENGYIEMDADGFLTLLPPGEEIAQRIYARHKLLTQFLIRLGVSPEVAAADACKIEHDLSDESFEKIARHALGGGERDQ